MTIETILPIPDLFSAKRVLCIQPHYDDNDIGAGGTLARLAQKGAELFYVTVTDDLMGVVDLSLSPEAAAEALKRDQFAAGRVIGVREHYWLGYPDAGQYDYFALRRDVLKYICYARERCRRRGAPPERPNRHGVPREGDFNRPEQLLRRYRCSLPW